MATNFQVSVILKAIDKLSSPVKKISGTLSRLAPRIKMIGTAFKNMGTSMSKAFNRASLVVGGLATTATALIKKYTALGDTIAKTSDKLGLSTDQFQKFTFAADRSGLSQEQFTTAMQMFTRNIGQAREGVGLAKRWIDKYHVSLMNADGTQKTSAQLFMEFADILHGITDESERTAAAMDLFGRSGAGVIVMSKEGSKGIRSLGDELERMGGVIDEQTLRNSETFVDMLTNVKASFQGLIFSVIGSFLPTLNKKITNITAWIGQNRNTIVGYLKTGFTAIGSVATGFWETITGIFKALKGFLSPLAKWLGLTDQLNDKTDRFEKIGGILAKVLTAIIALKFGSFITGLITPFISLASAVGAVGSAVGLFNAALWANPITWIIGLIVGLIAAIIALSTNFMGLRDKISAVFAWIGNKIKAFFDWFSSLGKELWKLGEQFVTWIWDGIKSTWNSLTGWLSDAWQGVLGFLGLGGPTTKQSAAAPNLGGLAGPGGGLQSFQGSLKVQFENAPPGTRIVDFNQEGNANFDVNTGLSMAAT